MTLLEKILKLNPSFDEKKMTTALSLVDEKQFSSSSLKLIFSIQPDQESFLAYILHNYIKEGHMTLKKVECNFGRETAAIIFNLNSVLNLSIGQNAKPEILRKMFLTLAKDFRVVMLLLIDRLSTLQTAYKQQSENCVDIAQLVMDIYIPIADRLGIYELKILMEDICFQVLYFEDYEKIKIELLQYEGLRDKYIGKATQSLKKLLDNAGIHAEISGRMKNPYSIYKKMKRKQRATLGEIFDIFALRIIIDDSYMPDGTEDVSQCYVVLGLIHSEWMPIARRFKDYIAVSKVNGYRSLHTTILGLTPDIRDEPTEIQIRTMTMHHEAEFGIASHWWYKEGKTSNTAIADKNLNVKDKRVKGQLEWLKGLADLHKQIDDDTDIINENSNKLDLFQDHIFVLTPNGDVKDLPINSTPIDFAYMIHTEIGHSCVQAKVNGSIIPLDSYLKNGDVVSIVTKKGSTPNRYWLSFVKTHSAKYRIKSWFRQQDRENNLKVGRDLMNKELIKLNKAQLDPQLTFLENYNGKSISFKEREFILECIGNGHYSVRQVFKKILNSGELLTDKNIKPVKNIKFMEVDRNVINSSKVVISGESNIPVSFSACCTPSFGSSIIGYVGRGNTIKIHSANCIELKNLEKKRFVDVEWLNNNVYYVDLEIKTDDSPDISSQIWTRLKSFNIDVKELSTVAKIDDEVMRRLYIKVKDLDQLQDIMQRLENLDGVLNIRKNS